MSQPNINVFPMKLDGPSNYREWAFSVKTVLRGHGLASHLTDDPPVDKSKDGSSAAVTAWTNDDGHVRSAIVTSMKPSLIMSLEYHKTAKEMWDYLQGRYIQNSGALLLTLMQGLHELQRNEMSIEEYYAFDQVMGPFLSMVPKCEAGCSGCCAKKDKFIEKFLIYQFCHGLQPDFESIRKQLLNAPTTPSISDVLSALIAEETRLRSLSPSVSVPHSVLAASHKTNTVKDNSFAPCAHCKKTTHRSENCFVRYPKKLAAYRSRHATRGRGAGSTPIGSVSVAAASPVSAPSSWVLDSGASFHVSSDQSQLVACKPIADGASIQTADGTSCPITHQGSSHRDCTWDWPSS